VHEITDVLFLRKFSECIGWRILLSIYKSRREFLTRGIFTQTMRFLNEIVFSYKKEEDLEEKDDYFDSFEKCYPLLSEAGEMLMEEAHRKGIEIEGKSRLEIAREIFSTQGNPGNQGKEVNNNYSERLHE
jgi:hypothetical protein